MNYIEKKVMNNDIQGIDTALLQTHEVWRGILTSCKYGNAEALKVLVDRLNSFDELPDKAFHAISIATSSDHVDCVKILLEKGASYTNYTGVSCLSEIRSTIMHDLFSQYISVKRDQVPKDENLHTYQETAV